MGKEHRSEVRGVKVRKPAPKPAAVKTEDEVRVTGGRRARNADHLARVKELKANWSMLLLLTAIAGNEWTADEFKSDFLLHELHYVSSAYEVRLPFEWVAALDKDEGRVSVIYDHWTRMKELRSERTTEQSRERRKKQLLDGMSADDKDILGIKD